MTSVSASDETQAHSNGARMLRKAASIFKNPTTLDKKKKARSNVGKDVVS